MSLESGSPICVFGGVFISAITVGSIINLLFCWTNTVGGVNCCLAAFGGVPVEAFNLLASPPPPPLGPPLPTFIGIYGASSTELAVVGGMIFAGTVKCSNHNISPKAAVWVTKER